MIFKFFGLCILVIGVIVSKEVFFVSEEIILCISFLIFIYLIFEFLLIVFTTWMHDEQVVIKNEFSRLFSFHDRVSKIIKIDIEYLNLEKQDFDTFCNNLDFEFEKETLERVKQLTRSYKKTYNLVINEFLCKYIELEVNIGEIKAKHKLDYVMYAVKNTILLNREVEYNTKICFELIAKNVTFDILKGCYLNLFLQPSNLVMNRFLVFPNIFLFLKNFLYSFNLELKFCINFITISLIKRNLVSFFMSFINMEVNFVARSILVGLEHFIFIFFKSLNYLKKEFYNLLNTILKNIYINYILQRLNRK